VLLDPFDFFPDVKAPSQVITWDAGRVATARWTYPEGPDWRSCAGGAVQGAAEQLVYDLAIWGLGRGGPPSGNDLLMAAGISCFTGGGGSSNTIRWSSRTVKIAAEELELGSQTVWVETRAEAEELFLRLYHGDGYVNTTGMTGTEVNRFFTAGRPGTYHWSDELDSAGSLMNHDPGDAHALYRHLQIHTKAGTVIRINFGERLHSSLIEEAIR
jgi:hypothetical protein